MISNMDGVRGEVKEYTWGKLWWDGTKEFNNGALQYADGTLEFDGLTFYPGGVVIDASGQQVGLASEDQDTEPDAGEKETTQPSTGEEAVDIEQEEVDEAEEVEDVIAEELLQDDDELIIEEVDEAESYYLPEREER